VDLRHYVPHAGLSRGWQQHRVMIANNHNSMMTASKRLMQ
jgi:hypothetical protein